jgi:hypothetical protein
MGKASLSAAADVNLSWPASIHFRRTDMPIILWLLGVPLVVVVLLMLFHVI